MSGFGSGILPDYQGSCDNTNTPDASADPDENLRQIAVRLGQMLSSTWRVTRSALQPLAATQYSACTLLRGFIESLSDPVVLLYLRRAGNGGAKLRVVEVV